MKTKNGMPMYADAPKKQNQNYKIIAFAGRAQVGKDTAGEMAQKFLFLAAEKPNHLFRIRRFADKIKEITASLIGCRVSTLENTTFKEMKLSETLGCKTPRQIMQLLGTEFGRNLIHPDLWVDILMNDIFENSIITDVRFLNEANAIKERGGILIKIERDNGTESTHVSETALNSCDIDTFDYTISNNGTLEDLAKKVNAILKIEGLI